MYPIYNIRTAANKPILLSPPGGFMRILGKGVG
jgi:hypothetical protein